VLRAIPLLFVSEESKKEALQGLEGVLSQIPGLLSDERYLGVEGAAELACFVSSFTATDGSQQ
jgi:hypothetical protein